VSFRLSLACALGTGAWGRLAPRAAAGNLVYLCERILLIRRRKVRTKCCCTVAPGCGVRKPTLAKEIVPDQREVAVTASGMTDELIALEQARARLEAELADDENWRALRQSDEQDEEGEGSAARRARNTRLKMALAENPLYLAWRHLGEAIAALRESGTSGRHSPDVHSAVAADGVRADTGPMARRLAVSRMESLHEADDGAERQDAVASAFPGQHAMAQAPASDSPTAALARGLAGAEPDEATVTFVRREPLLPSAQLPADLGSPRASELFERLRGVSGEAGPTGSFAAPEAGTEEAEVMIVTADGARAQREAAARAGTIRRLRKALSGD
jgi:hypothetical protein